MWFVSHKEWNRLQHALHGNTSDGDNGMQTGSGGEGEGGAKRDHRKGRRPRFPKRTQTGPSSSSAVDDSTNAGASGASTGKAAGSAPPLGTTVTAPAKATGTVPPDPWAKGNTDPWIVWLARTGGNIMAPAAGARLLGGPSTGPSERGTASACTHAAPSATAAGGPDGTSSGPGAPPAQVATALPAAATGKGGPATQDKGKKPVRAPWETAGAMEGVHLAPETQIQGPGDTQLPMTRVDGVRPDATGLAFATRKTALGLASVRSASPLALILPGHVGNDTTILKVEASRLLKAKVIIYDPSLKRHASRAVTLMQLGRAHVELTPAATTVQVVSHKVVELWLEADERFTPKAEWEKITQHSAREVFTGQLKAGIDAAQFDTIATERPLPRGNLYQMMIRVPETARSALLIFSGILSSLFVRDDRRPGKEPPSELVIKLGLLTLEIARNLDRDVQGLRGLVRLADGLGVRVERTEIAQARELLCSDDSRFGASNRHVIATIFFEASALPAAWADLREAQKVAKLFAELATPWHVFPIRFWIDVGDRESCTWVVGAAAPPALGPLPLRVPTSQGTVLVQETEDNVKGGQNMKHGTKGGQRMSKGGPNMMKGGQNMKHGKKGSQGKGPRDPVSRSSSSSASQLALPPASPVRVYAG